MVPPIVGSRTCHGSDRSRGIRGLRPTGSTRVRAILLALSLFFGLAVYVFHTAQQRTCAQPLLIRKLRGVGVLTWIYALVQMVDMRFYNSRWAQRRRASTRHPRQPARLAVRSDARVVRHSVLRAHRGSSLVRRRTRDPRPELPRLPDPPAASDAIRRAVAVVVCADRAVGSMPPSYAVPHETSISLSSHDDSC